MPAGNVLGVLSRKEYKMENILIFIGIISVWFVLQIYILPKLGISTWMRESCQVTGKKDQGVQIESKKRNSDDLKPDKIEKWAKVTKVVARYNEIRSETFADKRRLRNGTSCKGFGALIYNINNDIFL